MAFEILFLLELYELSGIRLIFCTIRNQLGLLPRASPPTFFGPSTTILHKVDGQDVSLPPPLVVTATFRIGVAKHETVPPLVLLRPYSCSGRRE